MHPEVVQDSRGAYFEQLQSHIFNSMPFEFRVSIILHARRPAALTNPVLHLF
jgi:hypothetical protein